MSDTTPTPDSGSAVPASIDTSVPHAARVWNYWLGGKDNYPADREVGDQMRERFPEIVEFARQGRGFQMRAVRYLAGEAGVRQFLDVGTGMPTANNTHEVAQAVAPEARIVYVDFDPLVLVHAEALLVGTEEGMTDYVHADLREPEVVLTEARERLDFDQPVALMLMGVIGHVPLAESYGIVRHLVDALPPGSYLALWDMVNTVPKVNEAQDWYNASAPLPYHQRSPEDVARFFDGLDLVPPGLVPCPDWHPAPTEIGARTHLEPVNRCAVGRKRT